MKTYAPELKAQVIAELRAGSNDRYLAAKYNIPRSTIRNWAGTLGDVRVTRENKEEFDSRVINFATTALATLEAILLHARDKSWLAQQNAHDLAIFLGTTTDKVGAILAAIERGHDLARAEDEREEAKRLVAGGAGDDGEQGTLAPDATP